MGVSPRNIFLPCKAGLREKYDARIFAALRRFASTLRRVAPAKAGLRKIQRISGLAEPTGFPTPVPGTGGLCPGNLKEISEGTKSPKFLWNFRVLRP